MKFYAYCAALLKINPEFGDSLFKDMQPILFKVAVVVVIINFIKNLAKWDFKNIVIETLICAVVLVLIGNPEMLINLGEFIVELLIELGGDLIKE